MLLNLLPSLNQWYKACYYQAFKPNPGYWHYPTQGDKLPPQTSSFLTFTDNSCVKTGANYVESHKNIFGWHSKSYYCDNWLTGYEHEYFLASNGENYINAPVYNNWGSDGLFSFTTPVGLFKDSPGPYGTYDMGGNVREWTGDFFTTQVSRKESTVDDSSTNSEEGEYKVIEYKYDYVAPGGSYNETSDQLLSKNAKKAFDASGGPTIGLRVAAVANVSNPVEQDFNDPSSNGPITNQKLIQQTMNVVFSQACAYGLEAALNFCYRNHRTMSELIAPFTLQRNITNILVMGITIGLTTGEAAHMSISPENFYWDVAYIFAATAFTVVASELVAGAMLEPLIGEFLKSLGAYGYLSAVQSTSEGWSWSRIAVNIFYTVSNATYTTKADLDDFNRLQKQSAN